jgi:hypothetical protein
LLLCHFTSLSIRSISSAARPQISYAHQLRHLKFVEPISWSISITPPSAPHRFFSNELLLLFRHSGSSSQSSKYTDRACSKTGGLTISQVLIRN